MTNPHRFSIGTDGQRLALARWGAEDLRKPPALLMHGTGFVAEVWDDVPDQLRPAAALVMEAHLQKLEAEGRLPEGLFE